MPLSVSVRCKCRLSINYRLSVISLKFKAKVELNLVKLQANKKNSIKKKQSTRRCRCLEMHLQIMFLDNTINNKTFTSSAPFQSFPSLLGDKPYSETLTTITCWVLLEDENKLKFSLYFLPGPRVLR